MVDGPVVNRELSIHDVLELEAEDLMRHWLTRYVWWGRRWLALRILGQHGGIRYMSIFEAGRELGHREAQEAIRSTLNQGKGATRDG